MRHNIYVLVFLVIFGKCIALDNRPVILARSGNLEIAAAPGSNIKLNVTAGGKLLIQETDITAMIKEMSSSMETLQQCSADSKTALTKISTFEGDMTSNGVMGRLNSLEKLTNTTNRLVYLISRPMRRRINNIQKRLSSLIQSISLNECNSNPCQHGGTCQDLYNAYSCICPSNWEGGNCEKDVNECDKFRGTDLGCQNNAKCVNTPGDYECKCAEGWYGMHCTKATQDCSNSVEVCGHGTCIPLGNGYKCLCDQGWKTDGTKPACTVDINECDTYHPPCSSNPPVQCINLPGTFYCGHCPAGYTGNGFYCSDINECEILNGGCSMYPMVQCVNVPGSRICGRCPPGYTGNGITCTFEGVCGVSNGGCHPLAQCRDNPRISSTYVECVCPPGYGGDGYGPNGCVQGGSLDWCASKPCEHGTCALTGNGYVCNCTTKYTGRNCNIRKDACFSNPCQNGGTCKALAFSFYCSCAAGFSGPVCLNNIRQCGQMLAPDGQLIYPPPEQEFNRNTQISCAVRIKATSAKVINVTIHGAYLPVCSHNYFQIHDGKDTGTPLIGRFCDDKLKNGSTIVSTTDSLYLWLKGDALAPKPFINISWTSVKPVCGSYIEVDEAGTFKSPGSPQNYPPNRDCYWKLKAPLNKRIKFTFYHLDIGNNTDCTKDYLSFNEGLEPKDKFFFQRCKAGIIEPVLSPSNEVTIRLHTIGSYTGFLIHYSLIDGIVGCGGIYTHSIGVISSPSFTPSDEDVACKFKIKLNYQARIKLHFNNFAGVGDSNLCGSDSYSLAIYEGSDVSRLTGRYCGRNKPPDLIIMDSQALIEYKPSENAHFELEYNTVCGGTYTTESGTIQPDNYPTPVTIEEPIECIYVIMRPPNNRIQIDFNGLDLGNKSNWNCQMGFLDILEGNQDKPTTIRHYCTMRADEIIFSTSNVVTIKYVAKSGTIVGFSLNYKSLADSECGGVRTDKFGSVESPRDLHTFENGLNCTWLLSAPSGYLIEINWLTFNLEDSFHCIYDYIQVFDNITTGNDDEPKSTEMGKYCGNRLPPTMTTTSNVATVFFKIDSLNNFDGFYFTYRFITASNVCGGHYFSPSGLIRSPLYPLPYPNNRNCIWIITAPPGQQVQLNFTSFDIEESSGCRYDYLQVLNGGTLTAPSIGKYCGGAKPKRIYSHTNQLYIQFLSDKTKQGQGFEIRWTTTATGCGGTLSSPGGTIISPNYPEPYGRNAECFWKISVSAGSKVQAVFADLDLEYINGCFLDYVDFYDGTDTMSKKLGSYCKLDGTSPLITSTGNHLTVKFHSDINYQGRGFQLQYSTQCRTNITGFGGAIENPNFPGNPPQGQECEWQINVPEGNKINLTFSHFMFTSMTDDCDNSYLEIGYEDSYEYKALGKYCDKNPQDDEIHIPSNVAKVKLHFGSQYLLAQFRLEWVLSGCGGMLTRPEGTIQTPNYPNSYPLSTTCNWHIQTEFGKSIELTFGKVDMELNRNCDLDYIKVFNGPDETYPEVTKLCHSTNASTVITGTGRELFVSFVSDISYTAKGFQATYRTVNTKCGGRLSAASGALHSPNYPLNYDKNDTCEWLIEVQENHLIDLVFDSVDLLNVCDSTFIKVYDGPTAAYPVLTKICGSKKPEGTLTSRTNHLYIELVTHALLTTKGFFARYSTACGGQLKTQGSGVIDYRSETLVTTNVTNCTWTIIAENPEQHILLTFTKYRNSDCFYGIISNELSIYDGENHNSSLVGTYCKKMPGLIRSGGNKLHIEVPETSEQLAFSAKYSVVESSCGGSFSAETGEFSSPNYPGSYPGDIQCEWTITAGESNEVRLEFSTFDLVQSDNCNEDYLEVRETNSSGRLIGIFCGSNKPINVTAMSGIWLYFKSERPSAGADGATGKGFLAEFALSTTVELSGSNGTITSPLYPERIVTDNTYKWQITVPDLYNVYFEFDDLTFDMGFSEYCYGVSLMLMDGTIDGNILTQVCGPTEPLKSATNVVTIMLQGASSLRGVKFKLRWAQMHSSNVTLLKCGSTDSVMVNNEAPILTHEFPQGSSGRRQCVWTFNTVPGRHLRSAVTEIRPSSTYCIIDSIKLFDGNGYGMGEIVTSTFKDMGNVCNQSFTNKTYSTTGDSLKVQHSVLFYGQARNRSSSFTMNITDACGGFIKKPNGLIVVNGPLEPKIGKLLECKWTINVPTGKRIALNLISNFTDGGSCSTKAVVHNGHDEDGPVVLTHCGDKVRKASLTTTGNKAYITFIGNYTDSLKIKFTSASTTECGGEIQLTDVDNSTMITTPNYPNAANMYAECIWQMSVPNGEVVRVEFLERFDLQPSFDCTVDGVELRDGATGNSPLLGKYCKEMPGTVRSLQNRMYIRYFTNSVDPRNGFKAKVSIAICGGTVRGTTGSIMSPGFNHKNSYPTNATCEWELWAPSGHTMNMTFDTFDMPRLAELKITDADGFNNTEVELYKYNGRKPPSLIQSVGNKVLVRLSTGKSGSFMGFKLSFKTMLERCGGELNTPSGVITTPNYPAPSKGKQTCEWLITVPKGRRIKLIFDDVDLSHAPGSSQGIACFSGDGFTSNVLFITDHDNSDKVVRSSDNAMKVYFWSYKEQQNRGFKASYTSDEPSLCARSLSQSAGTITRPEEEAFTCTWEPKPPMTSMQTLVFTISTTLTGPPYTSCTFANSAIFVRQRDSNKDALNYYSDVIHQFCKTTQEPTIVRTLLPYVKIAANQKNNRTHLDFSIKYKVHDCGGEIYTPDGSIVSPVGEANCAWRLVGTQGEQFSVTVANMNMDCEESYLLIFNGKNAKSPLVAKICANNHPSHPIQSQRHALWIEYRGSNSSSFNITYQKQSKICGGIHHDQKATLQTPSYPGNYDNNVECLWDLRANNGYHIELKFTDRFQLEESDGCGNDFVAIYDRADAEKSAKRYCGRQMPPAYKSATNHVFLLFRTNELVTGSGFSARWEWGCGGQYNATTSLQYIESPGYPEAYSSNLHCEYIIKAPGKFIKIAFDDFELEKSGTCNYDRIHMSEYNRHFANKAVFCGDTPPRIMRFYAVANLTFITDRWVNKRGFKLNYQVDNCGGNITEPTVLQENSIFGLKPSYYSPLRKCTWNILAPKDKRIAIIFQKVNITYNMYCYSQFVSALDDKGNKMAVLCGDLPSNTLPTIHSNNNNMSLKFQYYNFNRVSSFDAIIDFVYGPEVGCGGLINLTTTASKSIQFQPPGNDYDCIWHIQTGIDYTIKVQFEVTDKSAQCSKADNNYYASLNRTCCVYYEMRDGNMSLSDEIFSGCDLEGSSPVSYTSSGSVAQLRIVARKKALKVPTITITRELSICGHLNLSPTNDSQYIMTPNFPDKYPANLRCVWRIKTKFIYSIHLRFEEFNVNSGMKNLTDCNSLDRLEIVDRSNKAFHLNYDLVWKRKTTNWELSRMDGLYGTHSFCSATDKGYEFVTTENLVQLAFYSDSRVPKTGTGFKIEYKIASCNRNYTGLSGRIARTWQPAVNCTTYITAPKNHTIALYFWNAYQYQIACAVRWLEIYDGSNMTAPIAKICGGMQVRPIFSTSNEMVIKLCNTVRYGIYTSEMTYVASDKGRGCGGELYLFKGTFTSPLYPNPTTSALLCRWNIRVPLGLQVAFNFKWLDIKGDCAENYVKIFDSNQPDASSQVYCSKDSPAVFIATSGTLTVEYKSGPTNTGTGWKAAFMAITSEFDLEKFKLEK